MSTPSTNGAQPAWKRVLLATDASASGFILRIGLAVVIFPHGAQKALGWFGGPGLTATIEGWRENMQISMPLTLCAVAAEFLGSIALAAGFLTRLAAAAIAVTMVVAVRIVHWQHGFFMNWSGAKEGEGFEYHILAVAIALALVLRGGGLASIDRALAKR